MTGALGFVGLHLVSDLLATGCAVHGLGKHGPENPLPARAGPFRQDRVTGEADVARVRFSGPAGAWDYTPCALEEPTTVRDLLQALRPATIYHLAAQSSAAVSFREPLETFRANVLGTLNLLEAVRALPESERSVVVAVGSAEEYGAVAAADGPIGEDRPCRPISPYGASKAAQTVLCQQYVRTFGLPVVVARPFSHTGPGQDRRFALASFAAQIAAAEVGAGPVELAVGDLSPVRDYLDVRDVVRAYRLLAARGEPGEIYNVSAGRELTIRDALNILVAGARVPVTVRVDPARLRPADIPYLVGDARRLHRRTGWQPEYEFADTLSALLELARKEHA